MEQTIERVELIVSEQDSRLAAHEVRAVNFDRRQDQLLTLAERIDARLGKLFGEHSAHMAVEAERAQKMARWKGVGFAVLTGVVLALASKVLKW
jgi:hypothetical protein